MSYAIESERKGIYAHCCEGLLSFYRASGGNYLQMAMRLYVVLILELNALCEQAGLDKLICGYFSVLRAEVASNEGKLVALGVAERERVELAPNLPTLAEQGMVDFEATIWSGLMVPAATPKDIVDKLAKAVPEAMDAGEAASALRTQGLERLAGGPDAFARYIVTETTKWNEAARAAGLKK